MKKFLFLLVFFLTSSIYLLTSAPKVRAVSVAPFPPFSVEGNPDEEYYFVALFPLLSYIAPANFEVYENRDIDRTYLNLEVCGKPNNPPGQGPLDWRDYYCNNQGDGCDGGVVGWCQKGTLSQQSEGYSGANACQLDGGRKDTEENKDQTIDGHCVYAKRPYITNPVKGTDFANPLGLAFPKIQSDSERFVHLGNDNTITWGSHYLMLDANQEYINKLLVLVRANESKQTHAESGGEWPLGWVDWGYQTPNGKTLLSIYSELPSELTALGEGIAKSQDEFLLNIFDDNAIITPSPDPTAALDLIKQELLSSSPPEWVTDFLQSPLYAPSYRQGYARSSICVFDICCITSRCKVQTAGTQRALYYDTSISQAYNAAVNDFFLNHSLEEGKKIFQKLARIHPLVRFASSAAIEATPSKIHERLRPEIIGFCNQFTRWGDWGSFRDWIDYLKSGKKIGTDKEGKDCLDSTLLYQLNKERALATNTSNLGSILDFLYAIVDDTVPVTYHLVTVPDAMGQAIQELEQPVYDNRDTIRELDKVKEANAKMSNIVADDADDLLGGKSIDPNDARRRFGYYACNDNMFAAQLLTDVQSYVLGARPGCDAPPPVPEGKCDGQLFAKLIAGSNYAESSPKGQDYFNANIKGNLTPELMNTYAAAEKATGVPCEILAGVHFVEADNSPSGSLVSGRTLGTPEPDAGGKVFKSLLDTAIYAGNSLKGKVGGSLTDAQSAITALSRYNGGGNSNCQVGYPYPIPYGGCPRLFEGEDDPYPMSFLDTKHDSMYLLYCADHTACVPQIFERPGSFTVALNVYNSITKDGYKNSELPPTQAKPPITRQTPGTSVGTSGFFPKSCGANSLSTALGCLPYTAAGFALALLSFIVGIAGTIAIFAMLIAVIQIMTAGADAKKLQAGKDLFSSAVIGLLFLIFSVSLLRLLAGSIIKLPGF